MHHETIRLVSLNFLFRKRIAAVVCTPQVSTPARLHAPAVSAAGAVSLQLIRVTTRASPLLLDSLHPTGRLAAKLSRHERAREDEREGKSPSTQAGEFVREEMEHIREGEHGARSPEQAIAIGLSKARRAGVKLPPPKRGKASSRTRKQPSAIWPGVVKNGTQNRRANVHARASAR